MSKLDADPMGLILGVLSIVITMSGCCCGPLAGISIVLSIIGWYMCSSSLKKYAEEPELYSYQSYNNVKMARVMNIVIFVLSILYIAGIIIAFLGYWVMPANMNYSELDF